MILYFQIETDVDINDVENENIIGLDSEVERFLASQSPINNNNIDMNSNDDSDINENDIMIQQNISQNRVNDNQSKRKRNKKKSIFKPLKVCYIFVYTFENYSHFYVCCY